MSAPLANNNPLLKLTSSSTPAVSKRPLSTEVSDRDFQQVLHETRRADEHRPAVKKAAKTDAPAKTTAPKKTAQTQDTPAADKQERAGGIKKSEKTTDVAEEKIAEKKSDKKITSNDEPTNTVATDAQQSVVPPAEAQTADDSTSTVIDLLLQEKQGGAGLNAQEGDSSTDADKAADVIALGSATDTSLIAQTLTPVLSGQPVITDAAEVTEQSSQIRQVIGDSIKNNSVNTPISVTSDSSDSDVDLASTLLTAGDVKNEFATADKSALNAKPAETAAAPVSDLKNAFEKMLQTVASSAEKTTDVSQGASVAAPSSTSTSPANLGLESLARLSDAQSPAARSFVVQTAIPVNVGQPQWSQAVGEKVLWLAAQNVSSAEIRLDPPELGPMQVKVSVNQDQTSVSFTSHHPMVREVLDQNLHRLRDMFSEQGLNLSNVDVSDKSFSRQQQEGKNQQGGAHPDALMDEETPVATSTIIHQRLVDHYA